MSFPNILDVDPNISINRDKLINLLLASIAFEELGLAHLINAEAEKIQSVLGTLDGQRVKNPSVSDLERIDKALRRVLQDIIKKEMLLQFKLENVLSITSTTTTTSTTSTTTTTTRAPERCRCRVEGFIANQTPISQIRVDADVCPNCDIVSNSTLTYINTNIAGIYELTAVPESLQIQCPPSFDTPFTVVISGTGDITSETAVGTVSGTGIFTLSFTFLEPTGISFQMNVVSSNPQLVHDSGLVNANDFIILVGQCSQAGDASLDSGSNFKYFSSSKS